MWERIKNILEKEGGKVILIEKDEPAYVVMKLEDYEKKVLSSESVETEAVNRDIDQLKAEEQQKEAQGQESETIKVEDLPF